MIYSLQVLGNNNLHRNILRTHLSCSKFTLNSTCTYILCTRPILIIQRSQLIVYWKTNVPHLKNKTVYLNVYTLTQVYRSVLTHLTVSRIDHVICHIVMLNRSSVSFLRFGFSSMPNSNLKQSNKMLSETENTCSCL